MLYVSYNIMEMITKICDYLKSIPGLNLALILGSDYPCVVTALLQLHDNVDEDSDAALHSLAKRQALLRGGRYALYQLATETTRRGELLELSK